MKFTPEIRKKMEEKRNEAKRKRREKAEKAAAESALVRADRVKQRFSADDSFMEQCSSNLDLDNSNENRVDDALMEGCSSNFEIPSLADLQQMSLQCLKESQKLLKQNSLSTKVQNVFSKKCFFCFQEFSDHVEHRHYKAKNCKIQNFYTNGWSPQFEEVLNNDDLLNTDTLFDFSEEGPYKLYLVRDGPEIFNIKYFGVTSYTVTNRFTRHMRDGTFKELSNSANVEYGGFLTNLNKKTAFLLEGLLILSAKLGTNLINKQYEFRNIIQGLNCEEIKNDEEMKNAILAHHKSSIKLLKSKWAQIRWFKLF